MWNIFNELRSHSKLYFSLSVMGLFKGDPRHSYISSKLPPELGVWFCKYAQLDFQGNLSGQPHVLEKDDRCGKDQVICLKIDLGGGEILFSHAWACKWNFSHNFELFSTSTRASNSNFEFNRSWHFYQILCLAVSWRETTNSRKVDITCVDLTASTEGWVEAFWPLLLRKIPPFTIYM